MPRPNHLVGSWRILVRETDGQPTLMLASFHADGTTVIAEHPVVTPPGAPSVIFTSSWHGAWDATGPRSAICAVLGLGSEGGGQLFAVVTFCAEIALGVDEQSCTGTFVASISDRAGGPIGTYAGTLEGSRIVALAPATPKNAVQSPESIGRGPETDELTPMGG